MLETPRGFAWAALAITVASAIAATESEAKSLKTVECTRDAYVPRLDLREGSGATWLPQERALLVVGDSGTRGQYVLVDSTGKQLEQGHLPLGRGPTSDDLEGVSRLGKTIYGLTSGGWVREWVRKRGRFALTRKPYPIGDGEAVCSSPAKSNCGPNYEGLCLRKAPPGRCVGFVVSKKAGTLVCVRKTPKGRLRLDREISISVTGGKRLSGCDFSADGSTVLAGTNLFDLNTVYIVRGFDKGGEISIRSLGPHGRGFGEAIGIDDRGNLYRVSDTSARQSGIDKFTCTGLAQPLPDHKK